MCEVEAVQEKTNELHHARLSNNLVRPMMFLMFAGQITVGQLLPLLFIRESLLLPGMVAVEHREFSVAICITAVIVLLMAAIYKRLQFWAAISYAGVKLSLAIVLWRVDPWAAAYFLLHAVIGIVVASTAVRNEQ